MEYSKLTDEQLVKNIQDSINATDSLKELVCRHSGIYLDMINGYVSANQNRSAKEEMIKDKEYQIYSSALKFDPTKGAKFSTYLGNETKWKCLNMYNKNKRHPSVPIQEELIDFLNFKFISSGDPDKNGNHNINSGGYNVLGDWSSKLTDQNESSMKDEMFKQIIKHAEDHPDKRVGKIFNLRYVIGKDNNVMPWKNVSSKLKLSIQGCINIHNSAIKQFKQSFNKE